MRQAIFGKCDIKGVPGYGQIADKLTTDLRRSIVVPDNKDIDQAVEEIMGTFCYKKTLRRAGRIMDAYLTREFVSSNSGPAVLVAWFGKKAQYCFVESAGSWNKENTGDESDSGEETGHKSEPAGDTGHESG